VQVLVTHSTFYVQFVVRDKCASRAPCIVNQALT
jgi:hypothetical protein